MNRLEAEYRSGYVRGLWHGAAWAAVLIAVMLVLVQLAWVRPA